MQGRNLCIPTRAPPLSTGICGAAGKSGRKTYQRIGDSIMALEVFGVLVCWAVLAHAIWKWGPGLRKRSVRCPEKRVHARVLADQREAEFGCLRVTEVKECSLLGNALVACSKGCIARL